MKVQLFQLFSLLVPSAGFTQRATIDPDYSEIHVLSVSKVVVYVHYIFHSNFKDWSFFENNFFQKVNMFLLIVSPLLMKYMYTGMISATLILFLGSK
jgi:hypothetical protein